MSAPSSPGCAPASPSSASALWWPSWACGCGLLAPVAAWHYHIVNLAIARGEVQPNKGLVIAVSTAIALLGVLMIVYMLLTSEQL